MSTTTLTEITPETRVGDIVAARPALARLLEQLRIDYCCGGKQTLATASTARGLAPATVAAMLEAAARTLAAAPADVDAAGMSLTALADHIEATHHAYLRDELPRLVEMSARVAYKHGERDPRLREIAATVLRLTDEMFSHMLKEERVLFPLVRQIDAGPGGASAAELAGPIRQMELEHDDAGRAVELLRELTGGFVPTPDCCNTHRALLAGLEQLEGDLHRHVHKENNVMFPRALARAEASA